MGHAKMPLFLLVGVCASVFSAQAQNDPRTALPARQSGAWEVIIQNNAPAVPGQIAPANPKPQTLQQCTSADVEPIMLLSMVPGQSNCKAIAVENKKNTDGSEEYHIATQCFSHDLRIDADVTLWGDLSTMYSGAYRVEYEGLPERNTGQVEFQARRLGRCQAGQRPGDMLLPIGITVNVVDDVRRVESGEESSSGEHEHQE